MQNQEEEDDRSETWKKQEKISGEVNVKARVGGGDKKVGEERELEEAGRECFAVLKFYTQAPM